jgi:hypothetical protein
MLNNAILQNMEHEQMNSIAWYTVLRTIVNRSTRNSELNPRNSAMEGGNWACAHHSVKVSRRCGCGRGIEPCAPPWGRRRAGTAAHGRRMATRPNPRRGRRPARARNSREWAVRVAGGGRGRWRRTNRGGARHTRCGEVAGGDQEGGVGRGRWRTTD